MESAAPAWWASRDPYIRVRGACAPAKYQRSYQPSSKMRLAKVGENAGCGLHCFNLRICLADPS